MNTEQRLIELETKVAFMENTIEELNQVIADQQRQIDRLEQLIKSFAARMQAVSPAAGGHSNGSIS